jgi:ubiquinone/menaquinone biosynthesis C-methylase UbiE
VNEMTQATYILGHSQAEIRRLMLQAAILRPFTERLLRNAEIGPGMRVLDLGCGAGDVSMLAAELVGASGSVVGIDCNPQVIALASKRAQTAGLGQVTFKDVPLDTFSDPDLFDCVIGRYVLIHQAEPSDFLRTAARLVRPEGIIAFHEVDVAGSFNSWPRVWRWDAAGNLILAAFREVLPHFDSANRLIEHFSDAGLPVPNLFREMIVSGGERSPLYAWIAETMRSVWPQLVEMGIVTEEVIPAETLSTKLRSAVIEARSQIECPAQVCAWTRIVARRRRKPDRQLITRRRRRAGMTSARPYSFPGTTLQQKTSHSCSTFKPSLTEPRQSDTSRDPNVFTSTWASVPYALGADTGGAYCLLDIGLAPGMMVPRHTHTREDEAALTR